MSPATVNGMNFVVHSYGKFQPGWPGWNSKNKTKMVEHKLNLYRFRLSSRFVDSCNFTEYIKDKNYAILAAMLRKRSYFVKTGFVRSPGLECPYNKILMPVTRSPARLLVWIHQRKKMLGGVARSRRPSQPGWPGLYEEALSTAVLIEDTETIKQILKIEHNRIAEVCWNVINLPLHLQEEDFYLLDRLEDHDLPWRNVNQNINWRLMCVASDMHRTW